MIILGVFTENELQAMTVSALASHYNAFAETLSIDKIKKFRDKATGIKRVLKIQSEWESKNPKITKKEKPKSKAKRKTIKQTSIEYILQNLDDAEIVKRIQQEFPTSAFDQGHISWLRCTLYRDGIIEAKYAPRKSKAYKQWLKDNS